MGSGGPTCMDGGRAGWGWVWGVGRVGYGGVGW